MLTEVDIDSPQSAAEQRVGEWVSRVEASVETAHTALLGARSRDLSCFTSEIESACRDCSGLAVSPTMVPRLKALWERLTLLQALLRQAAVFAQTREQLETECILGYTPGGLERAL